MRLPALLALVAVGTAHAAAPPSVTTVAVADRPIRAFAQDGPRVAWFAWSRPGRCDGGVFVRRAGARSTVRVPAARPRPLTCRWGVRRFPVPLALAGGAALWQLTAAGNTTEQYLFTAAVGAPRERQLAALYHDTEGSGAWVTGIAGDGPQLAYAVVDWRYGDPGRDCSLEPCSQPTFGGIVRIGRRTIETPAARIALNRGFVATARANAVHRGATPIAAAGATIELWDVALPTPVATTTAPGTVRELAVSAPLVAALVDVGQRRMLLHYDATSDGSALTAVPRDAASLSADGARVVYRSGLSIVLRNATNGSERVVARASATPIGLSIDGRRIAWAENVRGRGRVRALTLP